MSRGFKRQRRLLAAASALALIAIASLAASVSRATPTRTGRAAGPLPPPSQGAAPFPSCPAIGVIGSRGSAERPGQPDWAEGLGPPADVLARDLQRVAPETQYTYNPYPALPVLPASLKTSVVDVLNGIGAKIHKYWLGAYHASVVKGEDALRAMIKAQIATCGDKTQLLLAGYSQGAQVTGNVYSRLSASDRRHIAGIALFGDPLFNKRSFADVGRNLDHNGVLGMRAQFPADARGHVLSYCHPRDPVCQGWTQLIHGTAAHKTYEKLGEPLHAAAKLTPFPLSSVSASVCGASGDPLIDVSYKVVRDTDTTNLNFGASWWAYDSGNEGWRVWQTGTNQFCLLQTMDGGFTSVAGRSPNNRADIPDQVSGHFHGTSIRTFTGTYSPQRAPRGDIGTLNYSCTISNGGQTRQCDKVVGPFTLFFSKSSETTSRAADWRYWSLNGDTWWQTDRIYLGDITR